MAPVLTSEPVQSSLILAPLTQPSSGQHWQSSAAVGGEEQTSLSSRDAQALHLDHLI